MHVDIPRNIRLTLYIVTSIGSMLVTYLAAKGIIGGDEIAFWTGFTAFIAAMASININPPKQPPQGDTSSLDVMRPESWR